MGQIKNTTVYPRKHKGEWVLDFQMDKGFAARVPVNR